MSEVSSRKAALSADSSDEEMTAGKSQLNADSSDEEVESKKISADSSDDEGPLDRIKASKISADSSDDEGPLDKLPPAASKSNKIAADSSEDEGPLDRNPVAKKADSSDDDEPVINAKKKLALKKPQASLDSSDEEDSSRMNTSIKASKPILDSDESDAEKPSQPLKADSSDEETEVQSTATKSKKRKIKRTVASDSDSDDNATGSQNSTSTPSQKSQSLQFTPSQNLLKNKDLYDAESSDDELPEVPYTPSARDKEGSEDSNDEDMESLDAIRNKVVQKHKKSPKAERSSAKNAMMEIRSESARITRESAVGLPYHRPKQRTLEEFLNRKKGTPDILKSIHGKKFDSQADKLLEEREKKMKEFYKSESEDEEEADDKDYDPNADKETNDSVINEEGNMSVDNEVSVKKTDEGMTVEKESESKIQDSGIMSGIGTSDESNHNTDEDKSSPNSPSKIISKDQENTKELSDSTEAIDNAMETEESLKLVLEPDTPNLESEDDEIIFTSQAPKDDKSTPTNRAWSKLEALKSKFGDLSSLEKTLQMTPTISEGADDDLIICETEKPSLSTGAQKLFSRFVSHAKACKGVQARSCKQQQRNQENLTIVSKKIVDGVEVLEEEIVEYKFDEPKEKPKELNPGTAFLSVKEKLKKEMMEKRKAERMRRAEIAKINNEEGGFDALPDEEELGYDDDEEEIEDEDEEYVDDEEGEDEEGESEPEENDAEMKDKKRIKSAFADDEAEDEDEDEMSGRDDDDNDSVALEDMPKKSQFKKIVDPELLSESSNTSDIFTKLDRIRSDAETPTLNQSKLNLTSAPSSNSSFGALISAEPRWTPFQDRISAGTVELTSAENTLQESPTNSQLAKKKLGFEGLFDQTDPDVSDIDDVIGLCSGKFVTQDPGMSQAANLASGRFVTQANKLPLDISGLTPLDRTKLESVESQDTVILGDNSRPSSRGSHTVETQDTVILTGNLEQNVTNAISSLDKMLAEDEPEADSEAGPGHGAIESDDEDEEGGIKIRKRKRRMVSDSEDSEDESEKKTDEQKESVAVQEEDTMDAQVEYDSDENEIKKPKFKQNLFDKKGKLRKDFFEAEAELSGGSDEEFSDDEDERGLDRLEMEEGDLDDIDDEAEAAKVGRIHQKVLLDEDQAALKLFQERFLEDGDLHTDIKRQKQFKWSGLDDNIEVGPRKDDGEGMEQEEETLEKWRLAKMEREKWIQEQEKKNGDGQEAEDSQFFQLADRTLQRMSSKDETANLSESLEKEKIFKSPPAKFGPLQPLQNLGGGLRGSFLARGDASLDKIAQFNKVKDDRVGAGAKGRNFVFAAISPPKAGKEEEDSPGGKKAKQPPAKKMKRCRTLDENSKGTIFNLL